jgi:FKBP-type peptidyl-prolyl cis-trans isomerase
MKMNKNLFSIFSALTLAALLTACGGDTGTSPSGGTVGKEDLVVGTGATVVNGDTVTVNYTGTFTNGTVFDSSLSPGRTPFSFRVGAGQVIAGWDQGLLDPAMKVGGRRKLTVPPSLGYGSQGTQGIPGNSTLIFDITLLAIAGK